MSHILSSMPRSTIMGGYQNVRLDMGLHDDMLWIFFKLLADAYSVTAAADFIYSSLLHLYMSMHGKHQKYRALIYCKASATQFPKSQAPPWFCSVAPNLMYCTWPRHDWESHVNLEPRVSHDWLKSRPRCDRLQRTWQSLNLLTDLNSKYIWQGWKYYGHVAIDGRCVRLKVSQSTVGA